VKYILIDETSGRKIPCKIELNNGKLFFYIEGYGDCCSQDYDGSPLVIEVWDNKLRVVVYSDINQEDPTHNIDLENARIDKRIPIC